MPAMSTVSAGARALVPSEKHAQIAKEGTTYVAPQVLVDLDHSMDIMKDETLCVLAALTWLTNSTADCPLSCCTSRCSGPVVGVMKVRSDEEALSLMNDSPYGLTASIWTNDQAAFDRLMPDVEAGTVFMNRADYLDPALGWTGVKESGRGVSLSAYGYDQLTRAKSVHTKTVA